MIELRPVERSDLQAFFEQQRDPVSVELAQVPSRDRPAFDEHWAKILADPEVNVRTIAYDGVVAGHVTSFPLEEKRMTGYWIAREFWGRGIASEAFARFLAMETRRPLFARIARHNGASRRILEKAGFVVADEWPEGVEFVLR